MRPSRSALLAALAAAVCLVWPARPARAEVIILTGGRELCGKAIPVGEMVRIELSAGAAVVVPAGEIIEIRPGDWKDEYRRRLAALKAGDAAARYNLAVWCQARGLAAEYEAELRAAVTIRPGYEAARDRLERLREERAPKPQAPAPTSASPAAGAAGAADAGGTFSSDHISAWSDAGKDAAEAAAREGEKAIAEMAEILGLEDAERRLARLRIRLRFYRSADSYTTATGKKCGPLAGRYEAMERAAYVVGDGSGRVSANAARTVRHETAHGFLWQTMDIASRQPWLHEALATLAEGEGESRLAPVRVWTLAHAGPDLEISLKALFELNTTDADKPERLVGYARAWSFAHFMFSSGDAERRDKFRVFLKDCRGWEADLAGELARHFPETDALEAGWRRHVQGLLADYTRRAAARAGRDETSALDELRERFFPTRGRRAPQPEPAPAPPEAK